MKKTIFSRIYFPGLISLVFLPLVVVYIYLHRLKTEAKWGIEIGWNNDTSIKDANKFKTQKLNILDYKNFPVVTINGNKENNNESLHQLAIACAKIVSNQNGKNGIVAELKDNASYGDLVDVLDVGLRFKDKIDIIPYNDRVYFTTFPRKKAGADVKETIPLFIICGNALWGERRDRIAQSKELFNDTAKSFWPALIPFSLMVFFAIRNRRRLRPAHC
ncbi:hypothetical protein IDJ77_03065 [Mucilaginibacter sp. ZT4R22]|uniref:Uncharacterized protein n=1 Tax=Mucilaginibacter pankratovii TaxID=2772110 RepID=A0ABR7WKE6_9SPHI|nr:hypothetical protein [Mucilaginibacter pankratovii]MBD1362780.1 hypothetical protein [Mucilaginibacter pankratovii]